jgi:hypothetical protein
MNINALLHLTTLARLNRAIRDAVNSRSAFRRRSNKAVHGVARVLNAKGKVSIVVCYLVGQAARAVLGTSSGLYFTDAKGRDITAMVLRAIRGVDHA